MRRTSNLGLLIVVRGGHYQGFHRLLLWSISSGWQLDTVNTETFTPTWLKLCLFLLLFLPEYKVMMSKPRKFLWSQTDILPKRHISETVLFCLSLCHSQSYSRGYRSKTRICFLYLNISMMKMEILTSRKFDKILISFKMFTFLNNLYFLCYVAKTFLSFKKYFPTFRMASFYFELSNLLVGI